MEYIENEYIQIFSKSLCPYCKNAKYLLSKYISLDKYPVRIYELDEIPTGKEMQNVLHNYTKQSTVPYIFFHTKFIGGFTELEKLHKKRILDSTLSYAKFIYCSMYICKHCGKLYENKDTPLCDCIRIREPTVL